MSTMGLLAGGAFSAGIAMGIASILSVGPNTIMLIREGLMRGRVGLVASAVWGSHVLLLVSALVLTGTIATDERSMRHVFSWLGLAALVWFAYSSLRAYFRASTKFRYGADNRERTADCVRRVLAIVWLNPLTYVERLIVPAAIGGSFLMPVCRVLFIAGLIVMATVGCFGYGFFGRLCAPLFRRANVLRSFDLASGILLSCLACIMLGALVLSGGSSPAGHAHDNGLTARAQPAGPG